MPRSIGHTNFASIATAFPKTWRSGERLDSIQRKALGVIGRSRNIEPWHSQIKSASFVPGELPLETAGSTWLPLLINVPPLFATALPEPASHGPRDVPEEF